MKNSLCLLCLILVLLLLCGCSRTSDIAHDTTLPAVSDSSPQRRLKITATTQEGLGFTSIPAEELGSNLTEDLTYLDLTNVKIEIDGTPYPLENALRDGLVTVEEIFAYARLDAVNKICGETHESIHGLTHFTYYYPEFYLHLVYDVFEAPDGSSHLISDIGLYQPGSNVSYFYVDEKTGIPLTYEDWGITFEVAEVSRTGITLNCSQTGGQHIGQLQAEFYWLSTENYQTSVPKLSGISSVREDQPLFTLPQNTQAQYTIDWSDTYGALPQGNYILTVHITDVFDSEQVHPLMKDYSTRQAYDIPFAIS